MPSRFTIDRELLIRVFFFTTFAFLLYQLFLLARPFLFSILVATMLTVIFYPFYKAIRRRVRNPNGAALLATTGVVLLGVLPLVGMIWMVLRESGNLIPAVQGVMETLSNGDFSSFKDSLPPTLYSTLERFNVTLARLNIDLEPFVLDNARELGARMASVGGLIARNALFTFFRLVIMVICLFFMFKDGESFFTWILNLIPMEQGHKQAVARSAYETFRAVTAGVFLTATAQGLTATIGFLIAGVRLPLMLGLTTGITSLLGASFVITLPTALVMMMENPWRGIFLFVWGAVVVGFLDNLLKPILIGSRARMPFVLVFFSILGGLKMYGLLGVILGPMLVAAVLAFVRIYRDAYTAA
jgi:predicted PurR-regulated permease PerM